MKVWAFRKTLELSTIILLVAFLVSGSESLVTTAGNSCTSGWYVTGYYTPHESDFTGNDIEIQVYDDTMQVRITEKSFMWILICLETEDYICLTTGCRPEVKQI